jgi:hypothetical protein
MADPRTVRPSRTIQNLASPPGIRPGVACERSVKGPEDDTGASTTCEGQENSIVSIPPLAERYSHKGKSLAIFNGSQQRVVSAAANAEATTQMLKQELIVHADLHTNFAADGQTGD